MVQNTTPPTCLTRGKIKSITSKGTTKTYDIGVEKNHNFFANDILVHNCQHDGASTMASIHQMLKPDLVLGMTATPFRTDRVKLCFEHVIRDAGIHQLIKDGYLSQYHQYVIDEYNPEKVAHHYLAEPDRWGKSIFYFLTHVECQKLKHLLAEGGVHAEVVDSNSDEDQQLLDFREGRVKCLINCMKLTEGFNDPGLQTAWVRDASKGVTIQMAGRAFRKFPNVPFKQIVQSKKTEYPITKTALPTKQFQWQDDSWRSLTVNEQLEETHQSVCQAIANIEVKLPEFLFKKKVKKGRT